ncbi:DUF7455 domain-containing protein [Rothia nasimurium]|uniref:DUF7455 domain-containing protein n=1 Tax=Rothia nasimurium TaxID=85336 RepID=UPI002DD629C7|nr:hypothetical protein [Rothia nasimurium]
MSATLETRRELTTADRCDACGAQAYVRVVMGSGLDLLFCGHHARAKEEALRSVVAEWDDQTDRLS